MEPDAPIVLYSEVEKLYDSAFVRIDTNEPSNLTLKFYTNSSDCTVLNMTLDDIAASGYQTNANFKPFHSIDLIQSNMGYNLVNGTVYYYKIQACDPSSNCAVSACANFTTKVSVSDKTFIFKLKLPENFTVDIPALNKIGYNFTETFNNVVYDVGIKANVTLTKNMNMTFHCGDMSIGFFGMNVLDPINIDLSSAFICNQDTNLMGMNSSLKKWNSLITELRLSGATDYIELTLPELYDTNNNLTWTNDLGETSSDQYVNDYVNCEDGGSSNTKCQIPVSMGFSAYTVTVPEAASISSSSGGGGGGGSSSTSTGKTYTISDEQFNTGYTRSIGKGDKIKMKVDGKNHHVTVDVVGDNSATITVSSEPQTVTLNVGDTKNFDVTDDGFTDISVTLVSIVDSKAEISVKAIYGEVVAEVDESGITGDVVGDSSGDEVVADKEVGGGIGWIIRIIVILMVVVMGVYFVLKRRR